MTSIPRSLRGVRWLPELQPLLPHAEQHSPEGPTQYSCIHPLGRDLLRGRSSWKGSWEMKPYSPQDTVYVLGGDEEDEIEEASRRTCHERIPGSSENQRGTSRTNRGQGHRASRGPGGRSDRGRSSRSGRGPPGTCSRSRRVLPPCTQDSDSQAGASKWQV